MNMLLRNKVDGIIVGSTQQTLEEYTRMQLPIVTLDIDLGENIPCVRANHEQGGRLAARKLIDNGCRHVFQLTTEANTNTLALIRNDTFRREVEANGLLCSTANLKRDEFYIEDYQQSTERVYDEFTQEADGIFVTDIEAAIAIHWAQKRGRHIPEDLKIVGYDGTYFSRLTHPELTTIKQPLEKVAHSAVDNLIHLIEHEPIESTHIIYNVSILEGDTTI